MKIKWIAVESTKIPILILQVDAPLLELLDGMVI